MLPEVLPRIGELKLNFRWFAQLMAFIFATSGLLPKTHPYLRPADNLEFGIGDVLREAGRNLKGGFRHIDQYVIYVSFLLAIFLLIGQFILLVFFLGVHTAEAASWFNGMFNTPARQNDLALMMLDKVFEIPGQFGSKFAPLSRADITPFGSGLHALFAFYNQGMLFVGGMIVLYYIFAVTIETMQTGTPFGQRFQEVFVPIRLVLAILLLLPLGYGFSAGQMLCLKLANWGSGFATNAWIVFNLRTESNPLGMGSDQLVALPKSEQIDDLIRFYSLVHTCRAIYDYRYDKDIEPYLVYTNGTAKSATSATGVSYGQALDYFKTGQIRITFGEQQSNYKNYPGNIKPYCGSIDIPSINHEVKGAYYIQQAYWQFLKTLWTNSNLRTYGNRMAAQTLGDTKDISDGGSVPGWPNPKFKPEGGFYADTGTNLQAAFNSMMATAKDQIRIDPDSNLEIDPDMLNYGWGGAGIWFNKIAEYNGAVMSASHAMPNPSSYPIAFSWFMNKKSAADGTVSNAYRVAATLGNGTSASDAMAGSTGDDPAGDAAISALLGNVYSDLSEDNVYSDGLDAGEKNVVARTFNAIFGTYGLFELRGNQQIHPLAKMSALGRAILDRAISYVGGAMVMGGLSSISSIADNLLSVDARSGSLQAAFSGIGSMFTQFAMIGITVGVVLYYVIPFLPFLYFFFAAGRWLKSIFEAMVGIPLWALAHLRIDGEGIPGPAAANGYFLLLEIFLRPILIIFGLMASVVCFSALAFVLDYLFDIVTKNVTGYSPVDQSGNYSWNGKEYLRSDIDQFFYTVMYAVLLYMMALSCFKLIDLIPNSVLRFIGTGVNEFSDKMNIEGEFIRYTGLGVYSVADDIGGAAMKAGEIGGMGVSVPINVGINTSREAQASAARAQQQAKAQNQGPPHSLGGKGE